LLALRGHEHKSLAELKEILGFSRTTIQGLRAGTKLPSIYSASSLARDLNANYEWLLTGNGCIDSYAMQTAAEVTLIEQFRNLTLAGQGKVITFTFDECKAHEKTPKNKDDKQIALKLIRKKK